MQEYLILCEHQDFAKMFGDYLFEMFAVPPQQNGSRTNLDTTPNSHNQILQQGSYSQSQLSQPLQISTESHQSKFI